LIFGCILGLSSLSCERVPFPGSWTTGNHADVTGETNTEASGSGVSGNAKNVTEPNQNLGPAGSGSGDPGSMKNVTDQKQAGGSGGPAGAANSNLPPPNGSDPKGLSKECIKGDRVELGSSGAPKECTDKGKMYNFNRNQCEELPVAQFNCNWAGVLGALGEQGITPTALLTKSSQDGSKLVACGQSQDGKRIAVQWIKVENLTQVECNNTPRNSSLVINGCYSVYPAGVPAPLDPTTEGELGQLCYAAPANPGPSN
jgi:hypothetical protein